MTKKTDLEPIIEPEDHEAVVAWNAQVEQFLTLQMFPCHGFDRVVSDPYDLPEPLRFMEWQMRNYYRDKFQEFQDLIDELGP